MSYAPRPYPTTVAELGAGSHPLQRAPDCCRGAIVGVNPEQRRMVVVPAACHRWSCPACAVNKAKTYAERLFAAGPERHITLTCNPALWRNPRHALEAMKSALPKLVYRLRGGNRRQDGTTQYPAYTFEYAAIWERCENGYPHIHLAQWGDYIPQAQLSKHWRELTGAYIVHIKSMAANVPNGHHWTKYLLKALPETASVYTGLRLITFSRGYDRSGRPWQPAPCGEGWWWYYLPEHPAELAHVLAIIYGCDELRPERGPPEWDLSAAEVPQDPSGLIRFFDEHHARLLVEQRDGSRPAPRKATRWANVPELRW